VRSWCTGDLLGLATYDRCNAQLEFLNGFDSALFVHCSSPAFKSPKMLRSGPRAQRRFQRVVSFCSRRVALPATRIPMIPRSTGDLENSFPAGKCTLSSDVEIEGSITVQKEQHTAMGYRRNLDPPGFPDQPSTLQQHSATNYRGQLTFDDLIPARRS